ncbi:MAG: D-Ala-D-Ala carboxypeptidase family metallohydrolase [Bacteroidales bacterium]
MNLTDNVTLEAACVSETAKRQHIDNKPDPAQQLRMTRLARLIIEPCFLRFGRMAWNSFFRCLLLNRAVKSKDNSQHVLGEAVDLDGDNVGVSNKELFLYIFNNLVFDQLIWEFGSEDSPAWVHVSYREGKNRKQALVSKTVNGKTEYSIYKA